MTDSVIYMTPPGQAGRKPGRATKTRLSVLEKLTADTLQTLRLSDNEQAEFNSCVQRFNRSRAELRAFDGEDVSSMQDDRFDQRSATETEQRESGMAVVHFMAPRILRLREGEAKRRWRSFLTKFRRDENLN